MRVSVIIVTYNAFNTGDIHDCLASLARQSFTGDLELIVVDNNSADRTVAYIRNHYPRVKILPQAKNLGFAAGNNIGLRFALKAGAEAFILLNQDTIANDTFVAELVKAAYRQKQIGIAQGLLLLYPEKNLVNSSGNSLHYLGFGYTDNYRKEKSRVLAALPDELPEIAYPSGAAMLIKRAALIDVGMFDEDFFMYHEDTDLGWRARLRGWRIILSPRAEVWHKYSFSKSISKYYYLERNRVLFILKNYSLITLILILPIFMLTEVALDIFSLKNGFFYDRLRAWTYILHPVNFKRLLIKRRKIQRSRKIGDKRLALFLTPVIRFQEVAGTAVAKIGNPVWSFYWRLVKKFI